MNNSRNGNNSYNNNNNNNYNGYERRDNSLGKGLENIRISSIKYNNGGEHSSSLTGHEEHSTASPSRGMTRNMSRDTLSREDDFRQRKRDWERRIERPRTIVKLSSTASNRSVLVASGVDVILSLQVRTYSNNLFFSVFGNFSCIIMRNKFILAVEIFFV